MKIEDLPSSGTYVISYTVPSPFSLTRREERCDIVTVNKTRKNSKVHVAFANGSGADYTSVEVYKQALRLLRAEVQSILTEDGKVL